MRLTVLLVVVAAAAMVVRGTANDERDMQRWVRAVEHVLSSLSMGPFREGFGVDDLKNRTRSHMIQLQTNRLRAHVTFFMMETIETTVCVCPLEGSTSAAITNVIEDLSVHKFDVKWVDTTKCPFSTGCIEISNLPEPVDPPKTDTKNEL